MSSLQKFHRRTNNVSNVFTVLGIGNESVGYWLAGLSSNKLIVAPKSSETQLSWGSSGTIRGTTNITDGIPNTTKLYSFGSLAHPAAYYTRTLSTGGYNTWYLPAKNELNTLYSAKNISPFNTLGGFQTVNSAYYSTSTEYDATNAWSQSLYNGAQYGTGSPKTAGSYYIRAIRYEQQTISATGWGNSQIGYMMGTAGDGISKLIVAPKSTEMRLTWGSTGIMRGTTNINDGLTNTNTLYALGSTAHPAAYYCKTLTTGGYNTWYMPAQNELLTMYSAKSSSPFISTQDTFITSSGNYYSCSTEYDATNAVSQRFDNGTQYFNNSPKTAGAYLIRAVRRSTM